MEKPKASENKAADVETKPPVMFFALPGNLRIIAIEALQTSSPKQLSVSEVNKICNDLNRLRPITIAEPPKKPKEKTDDKKN